MAVAHTGDRLVAVGSRGVIVTSDDEGKTWMQANVPVQSDLLAVYFPTRTDGWAVGHNGVILHTRDKGTTWEKQLDGRISGPAFKSFYEGLGESGESARKQIERNYRAGAALPFLDVWFEDSQTGYAVGSFGMIVATADGGKHWEPWLHRIDNPEYLNLNAISEIRGSLYIVGERGQVYRLDRAKSGFTRADTGYNGSFFGIVGLDDGVLVYGLRGTVYRGSADLRHWVTVAVPTAQTITAGTVQSGHVVLASVAGELLAAPIGREELRFRAIAVARPMKVTGLTGLDDSRFLMIGLDGLRSEPIALDP